MKGPAESLSSGASNQMLTEPRGRTDPIQQWGREELEACPPAQGSAAAPSKLCVAVGLGLPLFQEVLKIRKQGFCAKSAFSPLLTTETISALQPQISPVSLSHMKRPRVGGTRLAVTSHAHLCLEHRSPGSLG